MGTKNISLKESAYDKLASLKEEGESFSDLINRLTRGKTPSYADLTGIISRETVESIREIRCARKKTDKEEMGRMIKRFRGNQE